MRLIRLPPLIFNVLSTIYFNSCLCGAPVRGASWWSPKCFDQVARILSQEHEKWLDVKLVLSLLVCGCFDCDAAFTPARFLCLDFYSFIKDEAFDMMNRFDMTRAEESERAACLSWSQRKSCSMTLHLAGKKFQFNYFLLFRVHRTQRTWNMKNLIDIDTEIFLFHIFKQAMMKFWAFAEISFNCNRI